MTRIQRLLRETSIRQGTAHQMRQALCHFYLGRGTKKHCFDEVTGCSETTYYRIRSDHPELAKAIDHSARREALYRTSGEDIAFEARQKQRSHAIQEWAAEILADSRVQDALLSIVLGEPRTVLVDGEEKYIIPHPRDQIQALRLLQDIARNGCLPETETSVDDLVWLDAPPQEEKEEINLDFLLEVAGPTDFKTLTAAAADGREFTTTVRLQGNVESRGN